MPTGAWAATAGVTGLVPAFLSVYAAISLEVEDFRHAPLLPAPRRGRGKQALDPQLPTQVDKVATEAGVRKQL